jgi:hypothetical protein
MFQMVTGAQHPRTPGARREARSFDQKKLPIVNSKTLESS